MAGIFKNREMTLRTMALNWWNGLLEGQKKSFSYNLPIPRHPDHVTGREIEQIYLDHCNK